MDCKQAREKLPEFLANVLGDEENKLILEHLGGCRACMAEAAALQEDRSADKVADKVVGRILGRTRIKFVGTVVGIVGVLAAVVSLYWLVPAGLAGLRLAGTQASEYQRLYFDVSQFDQASPLNAWGWGETTFFDIKLISNSYVPLGLQYSHQREITTTLNVWTGRLTVPFRTGGTFLHPGQLPGNKPLAMDDPAVQMRNLLRNADTTVATVDLSLKRLYSLAELRDLLAGHDLRAVWFAVEAGIEATKASNFRMPNQQIWNWGIPARLMRNEGPEAVAEFGKDSAEVYQRIMQSEIDWVLAHRDRLAEDPFLGRQGITVTTVDKLEYVRKNGFKVYGFRVTGPSRELYNLCAILEPRRVWLLYMDFWNW